MPPMLSEPMPEAGEQEAWERFLGSMPWTRWRINRARRKEGKRAFRVDLGMFPSYADE